MTVPGLPHSNLTGMKFPDETYDLPDRDMLSIVVNTITQEMEKVNDSQRITFDKKYLAPPDVSCFQGFYHELHNLPRVKEDATKGVNKSPAPPILQHTSPRTESTISNGTEGINVSGSWPKNITHGDLRERFAGPSPDVGRTSRGSSLVFWSIWLPLSVCSS